MNKGASWTLVHRDTATVDSFYSDSFQPWGFRSSATNYTNDYSLALITFPTGEGQTNVDMRIRPDADWTVRSHSPPTINCLAADVSFSFSLVDHHK